jgi:hypothetical protein
VQRKAEERKAIIQGNVVDDGCFSHAPCTWTTRRVGAQTKLIVRVDKEDNETCQDYHIS